MELARLGVPLVPAVAVGDRVVHGWNPAGYAALLGVDFAPPPRLAPEVLAARLDRILGCAGGLAGGLRREHLDWVPPERARSVRDLAYHLFRLSLAGIDAIDRGELPEAWLQEPAPAALGDGPAVARYGAMVRARLAGWFQGVGDDAYARTIATSYGPSSGHELLERTTWHAAQHLRQLHALAGRLGVAPPEPLPTDALAGLPLPAALW